MARINLLTIHWGRSYGAILQTYATCKILEEFGHKVTVINLISKERMQPYKRLDDFKYILADFRFWLFKKRYFPKMTNKACSIQEINLPEADMTVVGSDQVWNRSITKENALSFFLDFVPSNQKRVALSSSFGKESWEEKESYTSKVRKELTKFSGISVRENSGKSILKNTFDLNSIQIIDPTLAWRKFEPLTLNNEENKHIFPFLLNRTKEEIALTEAISKKLNLQLFSHTYVSAYLKNSPRHWLTRMRNSRFIITDSFHGLAFSLLFHKEFFILCADKTKFTRIQSLLNLVGLHDRYIESVEDMEKRWLLLSSPIDYSRVDIVLSHEREKYRSYIKSLIN